MAPQHSSELRQAYKKCSGIQQELLGMLSHCDLEDPMGNSFWREAK